ncbi:hypothetical protein [Microbacterium sp.]|uniref:hypothetical protein n=1 Tax=Microbacterium sp. TaxID=51671 RepID=UPI002D784672|nr:hypothetical protein [Microbacterium sp.]HET6300613.1 hypothetical protein [Microbacterium sp.]
MSDDDGLEVATPVSRILMTEEAVYGLILVSGMLVISGTNAGTALNALVTVALTVIVFFAAHVFAGALARLAASGGRSGIRASVGSAARQTFGLLFVSIVPLTILLLGTLGVFDDHRAIWLALIANTIILGALGWWAVARWSTHWTARLIGALITASFGGVLVLLKAVVTH